MKTHKGNFIMRITGIALLTLLVPVVVGATEDVRASFRSVAELDVPTINVPSVVEVIIPAYIEADRHIGIYNVMNNVFVPYDVRYNTSVQVPVEISSYGLPSMQLAGLVDMDSDTAVDFLLQETSVNKSVTIVTYTFDTPITSDTLRMSLSQYAVLPENVSIRASVNGVMQRVVANISPRTNTVTFPQLTADMWEVTLEHSQPLRFTELSFVNKNTIAASSAVRFLAHPGATYQLYHNPEVVVSQQVGERPNILSAPDVIMGTVRSDGQNPAYAPADTDNDTIIDAHDNCPRIENTDQVDVDGNGRGDACDDFDRDGVVNQLDNCRDMPNRNQEDIDRDSIGDPCDAEESRITEKYPALVWAALALAVLVFVGLFFVALRHREDVPADPTDPAQPIV